MTPSEVGLFKVEPTKEDTGLCDCCGHQTRNLWGYVHEPDGTVAAYFMQYTVGKSFDTHPANFDLVYGQWGEGTTSADRSAVSLLYFENETGPGVMVIDAKTRPVGASDLVSNALAREDVVGTDLAQRVFAIFDAVLLQDKRMS